MVLLKILQNSQEGTCVGVFKKRLLHRCFLWYLQIFKSIFFKKHLWETAFVILLIIFTFSLSRVVPKSIFILFILNQYGCLKTEPIFFRILFVKRPFTRHILDTLLANLDNLNFKIFDRNLNHDCGPSILL